MNVEFFNPFLNSMSNVLATMATLDIKPQKLAVKNDAIPKGDVTGIISMNSPNSKGVLSISFSENVILSIAHRMLGEPITELNKEVIDLVGEITNMVCGNAKRILETKGYDFDLASPEVITGKSQVTKYADGVPVVVIPFTTDVGEFHVEVCFSR